ncbi:hypothetical protein AB4Y38_12935 [Paraburkholderia sp. EG285A]|uniref:hypothetical protein n=1 Tax=Paraburkholderia sp. EG285A TaxID=3237009 RepID=UPI0034D261EB
MKGETRIPDAVTPGVQRALYLRWQSKARKLKLTVSDPRKQHSCGFFVKRRDKLGSVSVSRPELNDLFAM